MFSTSFSSGSKKTEIQKYREFIFSKKDLRGRQFGFFGWEEDDDGGEGSKIYDMQFFPVKSCARYFTPNGIFFCALFLQ